MKTPREERCQICRKWRICTWSTAPVRLLCADCHRGFVLGEPEGTE